MIFLKQAEDEKKLRIILQNIFVLLSLSGIEIIIYNFILTHTNFLKQKFLIDINCSFFTKGNLDNYFFGMNCKRDGFYKALKRLQEKNIIIKITNKSTFVLNVPGLIEVARSTFSTYTFLPQYLKLITEQFRGLRIDFKKINCKKEIRMKIEEAVQKGIQKNKDARNRKNNRLIEKPENMYTPAIIYQLLEFFCAQNGIALYTRMTKKLKGQMRNWISDCQFKGQNIQTRLRQICEYWPCFLTLTDYNGKHLALGSAVNFENYYKNQQYIDPWLDANGNDLEQ